MIELVIGLGVALGLALLAVVYVAVVLPRRVARLMLAEHARADTRAIAAKAALHAASSAEVAVIVEPLRALLEEQTRQVLAAREHTMVAATGEVERITRALRELAEWLAGFAAMQHAKAIKAEATAAQTAAAPQAAPETARKPERTPVSRARPSPHAPAVAPPGSAPILPPEPAQLAAGLTRPSARPGSATRTPVPGPTASADKPRSATIIGLASPSSPTLVSMAAVTPATARREPPIEIAVEPHRGEAR